MNVLPRFSCNDSLVINALINVSIYVQREREREREREGGGGGGMRDTDDMLRLFIT